MTVNNQILESLAGKQEDNVYSKDKYVSIYSHSGLYRMTKIVSVKFLDRSSRFALRTGKSDKTQYKKAIY